MSPEDLVAQCRLLDQTVQNERQELLQLKALGKMEKLHCDLLRKDLETIEQNNKSLEEAYKSGLQQIEFLQTDRQAFNMEVRKCAILEKVLSNTEPNSEQQENQISTVLQEFEKIQNQYEASKTYQQILECEANDRELSQLISDKQNEMMKLETQQEF